MVMLRSNAAAEPATRRRPTELDSSSEFLSLRPPLRKSARLNRGLDDSLGGAHNASDSGHLSPKEDEHASQNQRTRVPKEKCKSPFENMNGSDVLLEERTGKYFTRKSPKLKAGEKTNGDQKTVKCESLKNGDVERRLTLRNSQSKLRVMEEGGSVRRSSRITRYKQSMLYDRLITNTAEAVLQKMDDMQKMRRKLRSSDAKEANLGIYSGVKRKTTGKEKASDEDNQENDYTEEDDDCDEDEEEGDDEDDDDVEEGNQKRYEFRQRKAVVRYQAPLEEPRKQSMFFNRHSTATRRRYSFRSSGPRSLYNRRRSSRRRHAIHSSDSTSSSTPSSDEGDNDEEEQFQRRRNKNRNRSMNRCLPLNLRKEDLLGIHKDRMKIGASLADVDPMQIDQSVRFDSIGGLSSHISALKEMVVFPLLYPEVFERFKIQPPRGCLFYGPPGTGKTLVARALANECSQGTRKVAFFMRKGADCLSKWVGESERQLRLLFDQAYQMRPSIIFFDEIDGLAPVRSSRQDQIHSSIVSTLLALMDGLDSRGEVVVIGATNRLDSIDPALRRPGRFDREFLFGLPDREARKEILKIHTRQWNPQLSHAFIEELADKCVGYCGADVKAVCAEAALCALRRRYPQIYGTSEKLQLDVASISISSRDFVAAMRKVVPASQRAVSSPAKALIPIVQPLLADTLDHTLKTLKRIFPHAEMTIKRKQDSDITIHVLEDDLLYSEDEGPSLCAEGAIQKQLNKAESFLNFNRSALHQPTSYRPRLLLVGRPGSGQNSHLAPAVLHALEKFTVYTLDMAVLFGVSSTSPEEACAQIFCEAKRTSPSVLYIPYIHQWWETVSSAVKATFLSLLQDIPSFAPILLLATCSVPYDCLFQEVQDLFRAEYGEVFHISRPTQKERNKFFEDLILTQAAKAPVSKKKAVLQALEVLPLAPPPAPRQLTEEEQQRLEEQEEDTLRELRLFLRDVTNRLALDKRFKAFTKPVDVEEVPDYTTVIKQPMDLSTVLSKIDLHKYVTVKDFLHDVDLIWQNALEYNPDTDPSDRQIRHRACALKDTVHVIIRDELDEDFEKICEEIRESRIKRGCSTSRFAPSFYHVQPKRSISDTKNSNAEIAKDAPSSTPIAASTPRSAAQKKKRKRSGWSSGIIRKKRKYSSKERDSVESDEDGEGEDGKTAESEDGEDETGPTLASGPDESNCGKTLLECTLAEGTESEHGNEVLVEEGDPGKKLSPKATESSFNTALFEQESGTGVARITRGKKTQVEQQQHINVEKALQILAEKTPQLVVDHDKLKELLQKVVSKTEGYEVYQLEKLYALLSQCIYRHRKDYDKTELVQVGNFFFFYLICYCLIYFTTRL
ncbi:ATPase family AAA domain-containing protein 2 isoform X2 [Scleropages formosus]|uniref:ATPase family AAA domain-containing protein 2 isoform X2 n=1 Tax=Scleropages formosus TaxID=113540 RepID=UPI0010FA9E8C|nr:ATPase family AAA domain-containing protein 2 isoform X2 [Scleropages formosus]